MLETLRYSQRDVNAKSPLVSLCDIRNNAPMDYVDWIRRGLAKSGKTQRGLARVLNVDYSVVSKILAKKRNLRADEIDTVAAYLDESPPGNAVSGDRDGGLLAGAQDNVRVKAPLGMHESRIPVYATTAQDGGYIVMTDTIVEYIRPADNLVGVNSPYAIYVTDDRLRPICATGQILQVHPHRPPILQWPVVVLFHEPVEGGTLAVVRQFMGIENGTIVLRTLEPADEQRIDRSTILAMHAVLHIGAP